MIVWLASYPRSGNTLMRIILKSVFGQETYSKYNDLMDIGADMKMTELVGHKMLDGSWKDAYQKMKQSKYTYFIKTHDYPEDDSKAIYIVRDGRASIVSYWHYLRDFAGEEYTISEIISCFFLFDSWGGHLYAWDPLNRADTFLIKYEDLINPDNKIKKVSEFTDLSPVCQWRNDFSSFHQINPKFFREGDSITGIREMRGDDLDLFWSMHGDWMKILNYYP